MLVIKNLQIVYPLQGASWGVEPTRVPGSREGLKDIVWIKAKRKGGAFDLKASPRGGLQGGKLTGTLPSFLAELKKETLIYQSFYFAKTAKNAIFSSLPLRSDYNSDKLRFNAWFGLFYSGLIPK